MIAEIDRALTAHELIKVRAGTLIVCAHGAFGSICERTGAESLQQVGKVCVLFRKKADD